MFSSSHSRPISDRLNAIIELLIARSDDRFLSPPQMGDLLAPYGVQKILRVSIRQTIAGEALHTNISFMHVYYAGFVDFFGRCEKFKRLSHYIIVYAAIFNGEGDDGSFVS